MAKVKGAFFWGGHRCISNSHGNAHMRAPFGAPTCRIVRHRCTFPPSTRDPGGRACVSPHRRQVGSHKENRPNGSFGGDTDEHVCVHSLDERFHPAPPGAVEAASAAFFHPADGRCQSAERRQRRTNYTANYHLGRAFVCVFASPRADVQHLRPRTNL